MRNLLLMLVLLTSVISHAQNVAINNDASLPDNSAILDIKSGTKGLLIPRMNTAAIAAIANPAKGLLVLDTAMNQLLVNMGTPALPNWQTIVASSGWSLTGNAGIDSVTNFIGTLNTKPLIMRVNNVRAGYLDTITNNTSFGFRTLDSLTTGGQNTAIGFKTLSVTKTGANNIGVGWSALRFNSSGYSNVAIGGSALFNSVNRNNLVAIGDSALFNNGAGATDVSYGRRNTAIGSKTLFGNTLGSDNTAVGTTALLSNNLGFSNTALGSETLILNTTGFDNTGTGSRSLFYNLTGSGNSAYGVTSLYSNGTGNSNSAFGNYSMQLNTSGNSNTAIGYASLTWNSTGYSNVAMGAYALYRSVNRNNLVAIGDSALFNNGVGASSPFHGTENTAIGSKTLFNNTTGYRNTAVGLNAMLTTTTGAENTANGYAALLLNTTGYQNTAGGAQAMYSNTTGYSNTAFGRWALLSNTTGINNTAIGTGSLSMNEVGSGNTSLGSFAEVVSANLNNATAIGSKAMVGCSNCLVLGSINGVNGATSNVNVGIGTSNPTRPLSFPPSLGEKILFYPGGAGEVGIGVYGNELRLHADNPGAAVSFGTQDNAGVFTQAGRFQISGAFALFVNGNIWANGITYNSDERFKQNITSIESPLQKILQINGVEYDMRIGEFSQNHFPQGRQIGLLAQNVEKVLPEAVNEKDGYKGVDYAKLVPLLVEGIKEQQKQIEISNDKVEKLNQEVAELKRMMEQLLKK